MCVHIHIHIFIATLAHELLQSENSDSFAWMQSFHCSDTKLTNPHTTRSAVMYDFAKGVEGTRQGAPLWIEAINFQKYSR